MSDQAPEPEAEPHAHTLGCGPVYFDEGGRWAKIRHPLAWAEVSRERAIRTYVQHGVESVEADRLSRAGLLRFLGAIALAYASVHLVPDFIGYMMLLSAIYWFMRPLMFERRRLADAYRDGWLEGRTSLMHNTFGNAMEIPQDAEEGVPTPAALDMHRLMLCIGLEQQRDLEVVMALRTAKAPDDLSGLHEQG